MNVKVIHLSMENISSICYDFKRLLTCLGAYKCPRERSFKKSYTIRWERAMLMWTSRQRKSCRTMWYFLKAIKYRLLGHMHFWSWLIFLADNDYSLVHLVWPVKEYWTMMKSATRLIMTLFQHSLLLLQWSLLVILEVSVYIATCMYDDNSIKNGKGDLNS